METVPTGAFVDFEILMVALEYPWGVLVGPCAAPEVPSDPEACDAAATDEENSKAAAAVYEKKTILNHSILWNFILSFHYYVCVVHIRRLMVMMWWSHWHLCMMHSYH